MNIQSIWPRNVGWLDVKLSDVEMNYLWDCCKDHRGNKKPDLAGNISNSQDIVDNDNWFWDNVLMGCLDVYSNSFGNLGYRFPTSKPCLLYTSPSPRDRQKSRMPSSA